MGLSSQRGVRSFLGGMLFLSLSTQALRELTHCVCANKILTAFDRYAEMPAEQKNKMSHRYKALDKLRTYLQSQS